MTTRRATAVVSRIGRRPCQVGYRRRIGGPSDDRREIAIRPARTPAELERVRALRRAVFVFEQGVGLAEEIDELDGHALHLAATLRGRVVGTCRLFDEGREWRLTRMAVERPLRGSGVGALLLDEAHRMAASAGAAEMVLSAQISARGFYARHGYRAVGETYIDAGIEHVSMRRSLDAV